MLNMDLTQSILINTKAEPWQHSPMAGVLRKPLAREDAEQGHATSIVRYEAGSAFRSHSHPLGEEILVLDGVFSDEQSDYSAGHYFRNPPGSSHAPYSKGGCLLLVKLHQFQPDDTNHICLETPIIWDSKVTKASLLYEFRTERVWLVRIKHNENTLETLDLDNSVEVFVLSGEAQYNGKPLTAGTWLREPAFDPMHWRVSSDCFVWLKTGHF